MIYMPHGSIEILKQNIRVLGIDDGPFTREKDRKTCLTGVLMRIDGVIENVLVAEISVDGTDSTSAVLGFVRRIGNQNINAIMSEGVTFAGFNIVDPAEITEVTGIPFLSITKGEGDLPSMMSALEKHGNRELISKLAVLNPYREKFGETEFTLNISGIGRNDAKTLLLRLMRVGNVPEPIRVAHIISKAIMESAKMIP